MSTHDIHFHGEIKKISKFLVKKIKGLNNPEMTDSMRN